VLSRRDVFGDYCIIYFPLSLLHLFLDVVNLIENRLYTLVMGMLAGALGIAAFVLGWLYSGCWAAFVPLFSFAGVLVALIVLGVVVCISASNSARNK
jgi:hypothetical protein